MLSVEHTRELLAGLELSDKKIALEYLAEVLVEAYLEQALGRSER